MEASVLTSTEVLEMAARKADASSRHGMLTGSSCERADPSAHKWNSAVEVAEGTELLHAPVSSA